MKNKSCHKFRSLLCLSILAFFLQSCTNIYYVGNTLTPVNIYSKADTASNSLVIVSPPTKLLTKKVSKRFHYVIYDSFKGYVYKPIYSNYHKYNYSVDGELYGYSSKKKKTHKSTGYSGGTVNVKGYYRKNGTYVKPYTRRAPTRH
jgi:hypothetical protein